jgi:hypothetical protein
MSKEFTKEESLSYFAFYEISVLALNKRESLF